MQNDVCTKKSATIDVMRLLANYLIVVHHASSAGQYVPSGTWEYFLWKVVSCIATGLAMPALFFLSGFLLMKSFSMETFRDKLIRRIKRLLIPFLIWNLTLVVFYLSLAKFVPRLAARVSSFGLETWSGILDKTAGFLTGPIDLPLWFLRTLLVYTLLAPIIWWGLRFCKGVFVYLALAIWFGITLYFHWGDILSFSYPVYSLLCFTVGAHFAILQRVPFDLFKSKLLFCSLLAIGLAGIALYCFYFQQWGYSYSILRDISFILATPALFALTPFVEDKIVRLKSFKFLTQSSFFLYAGHFFFCSILLHTVAPLLKGVEFIGKQTLLTGIFCIGGTMLLLCAYVLGKRLLGRAFSLWDGTL